MADTSHELTHPLAPEHLPFFVTGPGQSDVLFNGLVVFVVVVILMVGVFYMHLHSVPDRMAHNANHTQLQLIGILTLIALVTHNNIYWVIAIVIAALNPPDLITPINSIARSLRKMAKEPEPEPVETAAQKEH